MRNRLIGAAVASVFLVACSGDQGPAGATGPEGPEGPEGPQGPAATQTISGSVDVPDNSPAAEGTPVVAIVLDLDGNELAPVGAGLTDASGQFSFGIPVDLDLDPQLMLAAGSGRGVLTALVTGATQDVDAVTDGVANALRATVRRPGGTLLPAFDVTEITDLVTDAATALGNAGTDLGDADAVLAEIFASLGADISAASGATPQAVEATVLVTQDPPENDVAAVFPVELVDGGGDLWDINADAEVEDGTADSYDTFFELTVNGLGVDGVGGVVRDDRTVVVSESNAGGTGIELTRKLYVSPTESFARFTEVLSNPTGSDVTVDVGVGGNLGSDEGVDLVNHSSSGDHTAEAGDYWIANHMDGSDPALGWIFTGAEPVKSNDDLDWTWSGVVVPAGGTVTLFHFAFQRSVGDVNALADELATIGAFPPARFYEDATIADATNGLNGGRTASIFGNEGSVPSGEELTIENTTTTDSETVVAGVDGSFASTLTGTSGDMITITGDKGTDETLTVP